MVLYNVYYVTHQDRSKDQWQSRSLASCMHMRSSHLEYNGLHDSTLESSQRLADERELGGERASGPNDNGSNCER